MRISIIGHAGSGKSTLAERISKKFNIPHLHIDRLWFEAGGPKASSDPGERKRVAELIRDRVEDFIKQGEWVSDGLYGHVQPLIANCADTIIFLDISLARRLYNHLYRTFFAERHSELTRWDDLMFSYQIIRRTYTHAPAVQQILREYSSKVRILRNYKEVERYFTSL